MAPAEGADILSRNSATNHQPTLHILNAQRRKFEGFLLQPAQLPTNEYFQKRDTSFVKKKRIRFKSSKLSFMLIWNKMMFPVIFQIYSWMWKWYRYSSTLNIGTRWRWVVNFTPRPLYPPEHSTGTHWIRGWVGPRADREIFGDEIPCPYRDPNHPTRSLVAIPTTFECILLINH